MYYDIAIYIYRLLHVFANDIETWKIVLSKSKYHHKKWFKICIMIQLQVSSLGYYMPMI